ncbi:MAG: hypothetical protein FWG67_04310 [Defluviitaleaceae bacterium]|nr:hypothetical protein [Defluviitaleaceae bacterium]
MKTIKLFLEYKCFPIWEYDENKNLINNDSPDRLRENKDIDDKLVEIQEKYDNLFVDNGVEFKYIGFDTDAEKLEFEKEIENIYLKISHFIRNSHHVENCIELD